MKFMERTSALPSDIEANATPVRRQQGAKGWPPQSMSACCDHRRRNGARLVSRIFASWNQLDGWLRCLGALRPAA